MTPPFFVFDGYDVSVYPTIAAVERSVEPYDALRSGLVLFDATGLRLSLKAENVKEVGRIVGGGRTYVDAGSQILDPDQFVSLLRGHVVSAGLEGRTSTDDVQALGLRELCEIVARSQNS